MTPSFDSILNPVRLAALRGTNLLDTLPEPAFDRLARLATRALDVPIALVSLVEADRQFFKSVVGLPEPWSSRQETALTHSFCQHVVAKRGPLVVADARRDPVLAENLAIRDLGVVAYAGVPLTTADGHVLGSFCAIAPQPRAWSDDDVSLLADLAAAAVTEIELRAVALARERLAAIVEWAEDAIVGRDLDGTITSWNQGAERLYGYAAAEVVGRPADLLLPPDRRTELPAFRERLARGERIEQFETVRRRKDGSLVDVSITLSPVRDAADRVVGASTIARDVTERRRAEAALRFLNEASATLASSLDYEDTLRRVAFLVVPRLADWCAVHVVADDGTVETLATAHVDPAKVELAREIQRRYPPNPDAPGDVPEVVRTGRSVIYPLIDDAMLAAAARDEDHLAVLREIGMVSAMVVPLVASGRGLGAITFVAAESGRRFGDADLALAEDVAGRCALAVDNARLYREAQAAVRDRDEFLSLAAHELRTPVTGVKGYAQLLRRVDARGELEADRRDRYLRDIADAADRLARLTDDLLDVSRIRLGRLPLRRRPVDFAALLCRSASRWRDLADDPRPVDLSLPDEPLVVAVDAERVEQVVVHLLENAAKHSPDRGPIRMTARQEGAGVRVDVRDEGIGLPPSAARAIFEPFGRGANAAARGLPGLGLGLAICRGIVEHHGGRIWAESAGEDRGATLSFWLPASPPPDADPNGAPPVA